MHETSQQEEFPLLQNAHANVRPLRPRTVPRKVWPIAQTYRRWSFCVNALAALVVFYLLLPDVIPDLHLIERNESEDLELFESVAGVYQSAELRRKYGTERVVLIVSSNSGMGDFLENWICHAQRLKYKFIVHSLDYDLYSNMMDRGIPTMITRNISGGTEFSEFAEGHYYDFVKVKLDIVILALSHGYDVIFSDADIGFVNDPIPIMKRDCDFEFQTETFLPNGTGDRRANHGFYYAQSNHRTIKWWSDIRINKKAVGTQITGNSLQRKQSILMLYPGEPKQHENDWRMLDPLKVIVGNALHDERSNYLLAMNANARTNLEDISVIHANWVIGRDSKVEMLERTGTWIYDEVTHECRQLSVDNAVKLTKEYLSRPFAPTPAPTSDSSRTATINWMLAFCAYVFVEWELHEFHHVFKRT